MGDGLEILSVGAASSTADPAAMPSIHSVTLRQKRLADEPDYRLSRRSGKARAPNAAQAATTDVARASMAARAEMIMMSDAVASQYKEYQVKSLPGRESRWIGPSKQLSFPFFFFLRGGGGNSPAFSQNNMIL